MSNHFAALITRPIYTNAQVSHQGWGSSYRAPSSTAVAATALQAGDLGSRAHPASALSPRRGVQARDRKETPRQPQPTQLFASNRRAIQCGCPSTNGGPMPSLLSHVSAFEYWRLVGTPGFSAPEPCRANAPRNFDANDFEWFSGMGLLSYPLHGLTSTKHKNKDAITMRHLACPSLPHGSICAISAQRLIASPELTLLQIAPLLSFAELVGIMCEFCGLFTIVGSDNTLVKRTPLTSVSKISSFCERAKGLHGSSDCATAAQYALDRSRSPMETAAALIFTLPYYRGGYCLRGAELNRRIALSAPVRKIAGVDTLEPDIFWRNHRTCLEYDSDAFHGDDSRIANDARRKNALTSSKIGVVTLTTAQLRSIRETQKIAHQLALLMGGRIRIPNEDIFAMRHKLIRHDLLDGSSVLKSQYALSQRAGQVIESPIANVGWGDE